MLEMKHSYAPAHRARTHIIWALQQQQQRKKEIRKKEVKRGCAEHTKVGKSGIHNE